MKAEVTAKSLNPKRMKLITWKMILRRTSSKGWTHLKSQKLYFIMVSVDHIIFVRANKKVCGFDVGPSNGFITKKHQI